MAAELNLNKVIFELDAQMVINCFKGLSVLYRISPYIWDCHELYANMVDVSVFCISCVCNGAAHELALAAKTLGSCTWEGNTLNPMAWSLFSSVLSS